MQSISCKTPRAGQPVGTGRSRGETAFIKRELQASQESFGLECHFITGKAWNFAFLVSRSCSFSYIRCISKLAISKEIDEIMPTVV